MGKERIGQAHLASRRYKLNLIIDGLLIGLIAGLAAVAYRFVLSEIDHWRTAYLADLSIVKIVIMLALFALSAFIMAFFLKLAPYSGGSGIPQIRAELNSKIDMGIWQTLSSKFVGGALANISGLFLGREGPSIQLGGLIAKGLGKLLKRSPMERRHMITAGGSAGLAAAFNAPMSGVLFALEEMHKSFSPFLLLPCIFASLAANFISYRILGMEPAFSFPIQKGLPLQFLYLAAVVGVLGGLLGSLYNIGLLRCQSWLKKWPFPRWTLFFILMCLMLPIGFLWPQMLGGGHHLIEEMATSLPSLGFLLIAYLLRLVLLWLAYGSGAQGGIFLPTLVLGAILGSFVGQVTGLADLYNQNFLYLGMVALLTAVVRAPLLSILLVSEMSGSVHHFITMATTAMVAYIIAELLGTLPIYDSLYHNLLTSTPKKQKSPDDPNLERFFVGGDFPYQNIPLRNIPFPKRCLLITIHREGREILPHSYTTLHVGDEILAVIDEKDMSLMNEFFSNE